MQINYTIKDQKNKDVKREWKFQYFTKGVAQQWYQMLTKHKDQKLKKNTSNLNQNNYNNSNAYSNTGNVNNNPSNVNNYTKKPTL